MIKKTKKTKGSQKSSGRSLAHQSLTRKAKSIKSLKTNAIFPVVGIGASAGGLEAYLKLFSLLPANTGMAFVLVQHLSPKHLSMLSAIVQKTTQMNVQEVKDQTKVRPNNVYVIPPNHALEIFHGVLHLKQMEASHSTSRLVDTFFSSLAKDRRNLAIGIVLSGTGSDGSEGLRDIKAEGGISLVQEPKSAKYDGMPRMAIAVDHPDHILPIEGLVKELLKIASNPQAPRIFATPESKIEPENERYLQKIFIKMRSETGVDFSNYKYPTIIRRLKRRMVLNRVDGLKHYLAFIQKSPEEVVALFKDLLINVTEFFRNPEMLEASKEKVFPEILRNRVSGETIRIWVPGCSSGEEVYSWAISLKEYLEDTGVDFPVQIYGTDLSESAIKKARQGLYPESISTKVSEERIKRFFVKESGGYRICRAVRDVCIFSVQDVTADPPIHRLDILSCRNLMIYLDSKVQRKLMETFFYALESKGFLVLGASESVGAAASLFSIADDKNRIYSKRTNVNQPRQTPAVSDGRWLESRSQTKSLQNVSKRETVSDPLTVAENLVLEKYGPTWILVNEAMDIIHFKGSTQNIIVPRSGEPSWNLVKMLREELIAIVRVLILSASTNSHARKNDVELKVGRDRLVLDIEAVSFQVPGNDRHYLVLFHQKNVVVSHRKKGHQEESVQVKRLKEDLDSTQKSLQVFLNDQNAANEELQSANEEILSANEELQSTNEELETAKEELQSTNEELVTLNEELSNRNSELSLVNDDLSNVLSNANSAIVIVNSEMKVRRLTPAATTLLGISYRDAGHNLFDFELGFPAEILKEKIYEVINSITNIDIESRNTSGNYYSIRIRPYKTMDRKIDGAVISFVDVTEIKRTPVNDG